MERPIQILKELQEENKAIGQFNTSNLEITKAVLEAASELEKPVIIGTSEGERNFLGANQISKLIESYRRELNIPIILNSDHCKDFDSFKEAVNAGYNAVHIDASGLSFKENIILTQKCVNYAKQRNDNIMVEGELGSIKGGSSVHKKELKVKENTLTSPDEAYDFVRRTKVDTLAVAIGSAHGVYEGEPELDFERLASINEKIDAPIVLHGGSGISEENIKRAIKEGIVKINVNTELRMAYTGTLRETLKENPDLITPYKIFPPVIEQVKKVVKKKIRLFSSS